MEDIRNGAARGDIGKSTLETIVMGVADVLLTAFDNAAYDSLTARSLYISVLFVEQLLFIALVKKA